MITDPHDIPVDIGMAIKLIPIRNNVIELDVVAIITNVSIDFEVVVNNLFLLYKFFHLNFLFLK